MSKKALFSTNTTFHLGLIDVLGFHPGQNWDSVREKLVERIVQQGESFAFHAYSLLLGDSATPLSEDYVNFKAEVATALADNAPVFSLHTVLENLANRSDLVYQP